MIEDITDGTSNTILLGDKSTPSGDLGWMSGTRATLRNTGSRINAPAPDGSISGAGQPSPGLYVGGFGSGHKGGANFAFGDGSAHFLTETINLTLYQNLGHRSDGELVGGDAF